MYGTFPKIDADIFIFSLRRTTNDNTFQTITILSKLLHDVARDYNNQKLSLYDKDTSLIKLNNIAKIQISAIMCHQKT
jgi:hypothetical protein